MKHYAIGFIMVLCCCLIAPEAAATLYRWADDLGEIHYSTTPPVGKVNNLEVKRNNAWYPYPGKLEGSRTTVTKETPIRTIVDYSLRNNNVIIIEVLLNRKLKKSVIVDTGATYSIITPKLAQILAIRPHPDVPPAALQTANGEIEAPLVNIEYVTLGELEVPNVAAAIHDFGESSELAGILGLNLLNRFKMTVDAARHELTLEPVRPLKDYEAFNCVEARKWMAQGQELGDRSDVEVSLYQRAIKLCPDLLEARYSLGGVYFLQEEYQRAIQVFLELIRLWPDESEAHFRLGIVYAKVERFHQARLEFKKVLELVPDHEKAQEFLDQLTF